MRAIIQGPTFSEWEKAYLRAMIRMRIQQSEGDEAAMLELGAKKQSEHVRDVHEQCERLRALLAKLEEL